MNQYSFYAFQQYIYIFFQFLHLYARLSAQQPFVDRSSFNIERHWLWINTIQPYNVTLLMTLSWMTFMSAHYSW